MTVFLKIWLKMNELYATFKSKNSSTNMNSVVIEFSRSRFWLRNTSSMWYLCDLCDEIAHTIGSASISPRMLSRSSKRNGEGRSSFAI